MGFSARSIVVAVTALVLSAQAARAQAVLLQIRPRIGDTLRMHMSQTVEMTGTTRDQRADKPSSMTTSIEVFTRAIAQQWTSGGTLMQTITDSVAMNPASPGSLAELRRRAMQAKPVWLRVSTDGAMEMVDDGDPHSELRRIFGEMPAMLARAPVSTGESWTREMQIPLSSEPGRWAPSARLFGWIHWGEMVTSPTYPCAGRCPASILLAPLRPGLVTERRASCREAFKSIAGLAG